jgi:hypothetical protein
VLTLLVPDRLQELSRLTCWWPLMSLSTWATSQRCEQQQQPQLTGVRACVRAER